MNRLFRHSTILFSFIVTLLWSGNMMATHVVGGELSYHHINGDTFEIVMEVRRDCINGSDEALFDREAYVGIYYRNGRNGTPAFTVGQGGYIILEYAGHDTIDVSGSGICFFGADICVERAVYRGRFVLPPPGTLYDGYYFAYQRCCRNNLIDNILTDPENTGMTLLSEMSRTAYFNAVNENRQLPDWRKFPFLATCEDQPFIHDVVLDSVSKPGYRLEYSFFTPYTGSDSTQPQPSASMGVPPYDPVVYDAGRGFSLTNLTGSSSDPLTIDPATGLITGTPTERGTFLIGVRVCEFDRDDNLVACKRKEFELTVVPCGTPIEKIDFTFQEDPCDSDLKIDFANKSKGADSLYIWYLQYPDSSITDTTYGSLDSLTDVMYPGRGMYTIVLVGINKEGCVDSSSETLIIYNPEIEVDFSVETGCGASSPITLCDSSSGFYPLEQWDWTITIGNKVYRDTGRKADFILDTTGVAIINLLVTDSVGCQAEKSDTVDLQFVLADFELDRDSCDNGFEVPFINTSMGATEYLWYFNYPGTTDSSTEVNPVFTYPGIGRYQVMLIARKDSVCADTIIKTVTLLDPQLMPDFGASSTCQDSLILSLSDSSKSRYPIVSWEWSVSINNDFYSENGKDVDIRLDEDGTAIITLKITDSVGCMAMVMDTIELNFIDIRLIADTITICEGDSTRLVANPDSTLTYEWKPETGLNLTTPWNPWASPDTTTKYTLCVSDSVCTVILEVLVIVEPTQEVEILGDTSSCEGKFTLVAISPDSDKFEWSDDPNFTNIIGTGDTIMVMVDDSATIYVRTGMPGDCRGVDSIKVYNRAICLNYGTEYNLCVDEMIMINLVNCKPEQDLFVRWNENDIIITSRDSLSIKIMPQDTGRYELSFMVANVFGCILRDTIVVNVSQKPQNIDFDALTECDNPVVKFTATGDVAQTYNWNFGDGNTGTGGPMIEHTYEKKGRYRVTLNAGNNGCDTIITKEVDVVFFECPSDTIQVLCGGGMVELNPNGEPGCVYSWSPGRFLDDSTAVNPKATIDESVTFRVIIMDSTLLPGCKDTCYIDIAVPPSIDIDIQGDTLLCNEDSATLTAVISNPNADVSWCDEDGNVIDTTLTLTVFPDLGTTCYTFKAVDELGCSSSETVCITRCLLDYDIMVTDTICQGDTAIVMITNMDLDTLILNGDVLAPGDKITFTYTPGSTTTYEYELLNDCCMDTISVTIHVNEINVVATVDPRILPRGCPAQLNATFNPDWTYEWTPDDGTLTETDIHDPTATPDETTIYQVKVTDKNGCMATDTVLVTVIPAECNDTYVFLPNAFSPNDDGVNDVLFLRSLIVEDMELIIYNRWGQQVFRSTSQAQGWDGTFNGEKLRPDVYSYYLWVLCKGQEEFVKRGNITLLK